MNTPELVLKGFAFTELRDPEGLARLDAAFLSFLQIQDASLKSALVAYRADPSVFSGIETSQFLIDMAPFVETFLGDLFGILPAVQELQYASRADAVIFAFKEAYIKKRARRRLKAIENLSSFADLNAWLQDALRDVPEEVARSGGVDPEYDVATLGMYYLSDPEIHAHAIEQLTQWCVHALTHASAQAQVQDWVSMRLPVKLDYARLVVPVSQNNLRSRDGFDLTDARMSARAVANEVDYCVYCHQREDDFCSKGFPIRKRAIEEGLKTNALGNILTGCPLEEKISEMHWLRKHGHTLGALAVIMIDNPLCPLTGHRICNDCMKACIYQKQQPVDIPQIETRVLTEVLQLPWGVELYDLLTRWNPLRPKQWVARPYNNRKVMVMGMGPAGITLAHHLLMEGCAVVGADGLKIEPLPSAWLSEPIYSYDTLCSRLSERTIMGFGGVAEYGITARWDKNFLTLLHISLLRRPYFQLVDNVRFGGTITVDTVWELGFDHLAIAVGAGMPQPLKIPGSLAPGMRAANDFLMALQLSGAAKRDSLTNLEIRLPAVVIGGGLTAIDTATEVQAYYILQVERILARYEQLLLTQDEAQVRAAFPPYTAAVLDEFLAHGRAVRALRSEAEKRGELPAFYTLLRAWGGVTVVYRRRLQDAPAYRLNHEEVQKAFEEGIFFAECLSPIEVQQDSEAHVQAVVCAVRAQDAEGSWYDAGRKKTLKARAILVATGARLNIAYAFEHPQDFHRVGFQYQPYQWQPDTASGEMQPVPDPAHCKQSELGFFTSYEQGQYRVTFLGDTHPVFHGSVVKAMASGKKAYADIVRLLHSMPAASGLPPRPYPDFRANIQHLFAAHVVNVQRDHPEVLSIKVHAPMAVRRFRPGHFYRVQTYETYALRRKDTVLQPEALSLLGTEVDRNAGTVSLVAVGKSIHSRILSRLQPGDPLALMGPTGVRTKIPSSPEHFLIVCDMSGIPYTHTVGSAARAAGHKVLCVVVLDSVDQLYHKTQLENAADGILWVSMIEGEVIQDMRDHDKVVSGMRLDAALLQYAQDAMHGALPLSRMQRVLIAGRPPLLRLMQQARKGVLQPYLAQAHRFIGSVYGPMQCMLKGICAQCLQWQIDPETGKRSKAVFACSWQDQPLELVDMQHLEMRVRQTEVQAFLNLLWIDAVAGDN